MLRKGVAGWTPTRRVYIFRAGDRNGTDGRQERAVVEPTVTAVIESISRSRWRRLGCAIVLALSSAAHADVVELNTGERITGELKETTPEKVIVAVQGRLVSYDRNHVRAIFLTPPARAGAAPAPGEALAALKRIQAFVSAPPPDLPAYTAQLDQNRAPVEAYLKAAPTEPAVQPPIADAFALYEFAAKVWQSRLANSAPASAENGRNPIVDRCASLQRLVASYPPPTSQENAWRRGVALEFEISAIWSCAAEKISQAEVAATKGSR